MASSLATFLETYLETNIDNMSTNGLHKASRIVELADTIQRSVTELDAVLRLKGLPTPSFDEDASPDPLPFEAQKAQDAVLDATAELHDILLEPTALVLKTISVSAYRRPPVLKECQSNRAADADRPIERIRCLFWIHLPS